MRGLDAWITGEGRCTYCGAYFPCDCEEPPEPEIEPEPVLLTEPHAWHSADSEEAATALAAALKDERHACEVTRRHGHWYVEITWRGER